MSWFMLSTIGLGLTVWPSKIVNSYAASIDKSGKNLCLPPNLDSLKRILSPNCELVQHKLIVDKAGKGDGLVISDETIPKIDCGMSCTALYERGRSITLLAFPTVDSAFTGWKGCDFSASNNFVNTCVVKSLNADKTIEAIFRGKNAPLISNKSITPEAFSPNGDGIQDAVMIRFDVQEKLSWPVSWVILIQGHRTLKTFQGSLTANGTVLVSWLGQDEAGALAPNGRYRAKITITNSDNYSTIFTMDVIVDRAPPVLTGKRFPSPNAAGWNNSDVTLTFTCTDADSGVAEKLLSSQTISTEGQNQSRSARCSDNAGNISTITLSQINIDKRSSIVTVTGIMNGSTYDNSSVPIPGCITVDELSGIAVGTTLLVEPMPLDSLGAHTVICQGAQDRAGNEAASLVSYAVNT